MPAGYLEIKKEYEKQGKPEAKAEEIAAKIWNKQKAGTGQTVGRGRDEEYGTIKHGQVRFKLGSPQHKWLEANNQPYSVVKTSGGEKQIERKNTDKDWE